MRHPFFNLTHLVLRKGESDFAPLERREGVIVTIGPYTHFFDRPSRSVLRWPGTKTTPRQSPHPTPKRPWWMREFRLFMLILCGGGDVSVNMIKSLERQREILLTAGDGNVVEKIDLVELAKEGAPSLRFLQPSYLCSSQAASFHSTPCNASVMSWSRAPYVYKTYPLKDLTQSAVLCLSGRTNVWCERLEPGESRDFALGNVIAATVNVDSKLRPASLCHSDDYKVAVSESGSDVDEDAVAHFRRERDKNAWRRALREFLASLKILLETTRARDGFFVCEMSNRSEMPAFVYVQLNKSSFYGGSGLVGVAIRLMALFFRSGHLWTGNA